jgi:hypothetical protein
LGRFECESKLRKAGIESREIEDKLRLLITHATQLFAVHTSLHYTVRLNI